MFPRRSILLLMILTACGFRPEAHPHTQGGSPCGRIQFQQKKWDATNTRTLLACLVNDATWADKIESIPAENFTATARSLNDPNGLFRIAERFEKLHEDWGLLFENPKTHQTLGYTDLQSILEFSRYVRVDWLDHFRKYQGDYEELLAKIFQLDLSAEDQHNLLTAVGTIFRELPISGSDNPRWADDLQLFLERLEKNPQEAAALGVVAPHNTCTNLALPDRFQVRTISPLELGVFLFREKNVTPEAFVETFEQGVLFWQEVCKGSPEIQKSDVRTLLNLAVDEFPLMQRIASLPWSQEAILALGRVLSINHHALMSGGTEGIISLLRHSPGLSALFTEIQNNPKKAEGIVHNIPVSGIAYEVFADLARNPRFGAKKLISMWLDDLDLLASLASDPALISEWQKILQNLGPSATQNFGVSIESGLFQGRMKYLLYLMNRGVPLPSTFTGAEGISYEVPQAKLSIAQPPSLPAKFNREKARRLIDQCLQDHLTAQDELLCLQKEGSEVFPASARWLPYFTADWEVLYLLRKFPMKFILSPTTAQQFWKPMITGLHLPFKDAAGFLNWFAQGAKLNEADQRTVMLLGKRLFEALSQTPVASTLSPAARTALNPDSFKIHAVLQNLRPDYFSNIIYSLVGDPKYLETRRSFYRLSQTKVALGSNGETPVITALDELFSNFKIPFFSRSSSLSLALHTAGNIQSVDELAKWMEDTQKLLDRVDWWISFIYKDYEEPRRSVLLASKILSSLKAHCDKNDLWNIFVWIRDHRVNGKWDKSNLAVLEMIHEMGFFQSIEDLYAQPPQWLLNGMRAASPEETQKLKEISQWISDTLLTLFQSMSDQELYDLAELNHVATQGKFLSWAMLELGELVVNPSFNLSPQGKQWILAGLKTIGPPPLKSPETFTPLLKFVREHKGEFEQMFQPELLSLAAELRQWKAYPELVDFLTSPTRINEWVDLTRWLESPIPSRLWTWSLRLERRNVDPSSAQIPVK